MRSEDLPRDLWDASIALDRAYAPLRGARTGLSPARVRLALRVPEPVPAATRVSRIAARFTEVALAAAVTAFAFVGSASVAPVPAIVDDAVPDTATHESRVFDDQNFFRWIRLGRYASSAELVDAAATPSRGDEDLVPVARERAGLLR